MFSWNAAIWKVTCGRGLISSVNIYQVLREHKVKYKYLMVIIIIKNFFLWLYVCHYGIFKEISWFYKVVVGNHWQREVRVYLLPLRVTLLQHTAHLHELFVIKIKSSYDNIQFLAIIRSYFATRKRQIKLKATC